MPQIMHLQNISFINLLKKTIKTLTFKQLGQYLNFREWFMNTVIFEQTQFIIATTTM